MWQYAMIVHKENTRFLESRMLVTMHNIIPNCGCEVTSAVFSVSSPCVGSRAEHSTARQVSSSELLCCMVITQLQCPKHPLLINCVEHHIQS